MAKPTKLIKRREEPEESAVSIIVNGLLAIPSLIFLTIITVAVAYVGFSFLWLMIKHYPK